MALTQTAQEPQAGRVFHGELYVAGVEGPEWLMGHRVWSLYVIGAKGGCRFYLTDRHVNEYGVPQMGQRIQTTAKWAKFISVRLCFITQYRVVSDPLPR
jgi:hypothetical protein